MNDVNKLEVSSRSFYIIVEKGRVLCGFAMVCCSFGMFNFPNHMPILELSAN